MIYIVLDSTGLIDQCQRQSVLRSTLVDNGDFSFIGWISIFDCTLTYMCCWYVSWIQKQCNTSWDCLPVQENNTKAKIIKFKRRERLRLIKRGNDDDIARNFIVLTDSTSQSSSCSSFSLINFLFSFSLFSFYFSSKNSMGREVA